MEQDRADLIARLCTQAGMLLEDASLLAVTAGGAGPASQGGVLERLTRDLGAATTLIAAARVLQAGP